MVLTKRYLNRLLSKMNPPVKLTPEQSAILICWYGCGSASASSWSDSDFFSGINKVLTFYPDHRKNPHYFKSLDFPNTNLIVYNLDDIW